MNTYDFRTLNDKEFEAFSADLLGQIMGRRIERFKPGRDLGVDGRYYSDDGKEVILQCKHWANTSFSQLLRALEKIEKPKLDVLKPSRYVLTISNSLSRTDKQKIAKALFPHIKSESDILGAEDLNDLLAQAKAVETRHYKLWLHSSNVLSTILHHGILGRSEHTLEEIQQEATKYAITHHHEQALAQLDALRVVIITGEPGIGKTTLASHLCVHYVAQGFEFVTIADDLKQAEDIFANESKQIFYFDDFLGRNYLEALSGHEGKKITDFIRRVAKNPNKRFVLTSRSTILNQGKILIDLFAHVNIEKNEYELQIKSLANIDRARILYNHIWHSHLETPYIDQIYQDKRYRKIVEHKNFNPRLVAYITDASRLNGISPQHYWDFVAESLKNPAAIWENPFTAQQDDFGRAIILLTVLHRLPVEEGYLSEIYHEYVSHGGNQNMKGRRDFLMNLRALTGSFLNRIVQNEGKAFVGLFNPSIADYVLSRYARDVTTLRFAFSCLRNQAGLQTLRSLHQNKIVTLDGIRAILVELVGKISTTDLAQYKVNYLAEIFVYANSLGIQSILSSFSNLANYVFDHSTPDDSSEHCFKVVEWLLDREIITDEQALKFVLKVASGLNTEQEIAACYTLMQRFSSSTPNFSSAMESVNDVVVELVKENVTDFIEVTDVFNSCDFGEYDKAKKIMAEELKLKLKELGFDDPWYDYGELLDYYSLDSEMDEFFQNDGGDYSPSNSSGDVDGWEIDDLFERT